MANVEAYEGSEFPGANSVIKIGLGYGDCNQYDSFENLVKELQTGGTYTCTIRDRQAYTDATVAQVTTVCALP